MTACCADGAVCASCCALDAKLRARCFRLFMAPCHAHRMGFASLYTILRKPPAAARTQW